MSFVSVLFLCLNVSFVSMLSLCLNFSITQCLVQFETKQVFNIINITVPNWICTQQVWKIIIISLPNWKYLQWIISVQHQMSKPVYTQFDCCLTEVVVCVMLYALHLLITSTAVTIYSLWNLSQPTSIALVLSDSQSWPSFKPHYYEHNIYFTKLTYICYIHNVSPIPR